MNRESANRNRGRSPAFTLLEVLFSVGLLAAIFTVVLMAFSVAIKAWKMGMALSKDLQHGDFVAEQLVMALRSAYYPDGQGVAPAYGFWMKDNGNDAHSSDEISWVKLGHALVGRNCPFAESPHRIEFKVEDDENGDRVATVKAWRLLGQPEDFDPEKVEPMRMSKQVIGFNCRVAYRELDKEIDWKDEWEDTNRVPTVAEITLYLKPLDEHEEPMAIRRVFGIPIAPLSWKGLTSAHEE